MKNVLALIVILFSPSVYSHVIDFEAGLDPLFTYTDVDHGTGDFYPLSGYDNMVDFTGSNGYAFNPFAGSPSTFTWAGGGTFSLDSFVIAGAWGTQTLLIEGLFNNAVVNSVSYGVGRTPSIFTANWTGLDAFRITTGNDFVNEIPEFAQDGDLHWVMDNLTINSVPVPAPLALLGLGLAVMGYTRKKKLSLI